MCADGDRVDGEGKSNTARILSRQSSPEHILGLADLGPIAPGDVLAIGQAGAYGYSMASTYNARPRPAEVLVTGSEVRIIRARETYEDLMRADIWPAE